MNLQRTRFLMGLSASRQDGNHNPPLGHRSQFDIRPGIRVAGRASSCPYT
jgi:hypothetical protein